jgi:hypothetical protein
MLSAIIALSLVSLTSGDVVRLPANVALVEPGKLNWALKDHFFRLTEATSAIVVRMNPDGVDGVAELKVLDGTDRLGWVESRNLVSVRVAMNLVPAAKVLPDGTYASNYGIPNGFVAQRRHRVQPDFSQVEAAIASMGQATMEQARQDQMRVNFALRNNLLPGAAVPGIGVPSFPGTGSTRATGSHLCGAVTRTTNAPCRNLVSGPGYCYLHR